MTRDKQTRAQAMRAAIESDARSGRGPSIHVNRWQDDFFATVVGPLGTLLWTDPAAHATPEEAKAAGVTWIMERRG